MKNNKRFLIVLAVLALFTFAMIAGCGKEDSSSDNAGNSESAVTVGDAAKGREVYQANCLACHGKDGKDGHNGPNLQESAVAKDSALVIERIKNGGQMMPAFKDTLTEEQIQDLAAYITQDVAKK